MLNRIVQIVKEKEFQLKLIYSDDLYFLIDFKPLIQRGGVFSSLADPDIFNKVTIGEYGRFIEWPTEIDFCADALRDPDCFPILQSDSIHTKQKVG